MDDIRKKYERLRGKRGNPRSSGVLPDNPILFRRKLGGDYRVGSFRIRDFDLLFPLYLPFFPSVIENSGEMLFLDLETTSLSMGAGNLPFLIGTGRFEEGGFVVRQFLVSSPSLEFDVLKEVVELWRSATVVVTFNGKTFDIPLLTNRVTLYNIQNFDTKKQYDLYQLVRKLIKPANLHNVEEKLLGISRESDLEGSEIPSLYFQYVQSGNLEVLKPVMERNLQDIVSLPAILYRWIEEKNPLFFRRSHR